MSGIFLRNEHNDIVVCDSNGSSSYRYLKKCIILSTRSCQNGVSRSCFIREATRRGSWWVTDDPDQHYFLAQRILILVSLKNYHNAHTTHMRFYLPVSLVSFLWSSIQKYRVQYLGIDYCRCSYCETILTGLHPAQTRRVTNSGQTSLHVYLGVDFSGPSWTTGKNIWDHRCPCWCLASGSCKCLCSKYKDFSSFTNHLFA